MGTRSKWFSEVTGGGAKVETGVIEKGKGKATIHGSDADYDALLSGPIIFGRNQALQPLSWADEVIEAFNAGPDPSKVVGGHTHRPGTVDVTEEEDNLEEEVNPEEEANSEQEANSEAALPQEDNDMQWTARFISIKSPSSFVIAFTMGKGQQKKFHVGGTANVELKVKDNLNKANNDTYGKILERVILGEGMTDVKYEIANLQTLKGRAYQYLGPERQCLYDDWLEQSNLDSVQREAYDAVIEGQLPITIIQGPPGTGKTMNSRSVLMSIIESADMLIGSAQELDDNPICVRIAKQMKEEFNIIYFATNARTKSDFLKEDVVLEKYKIWSHIDRSFRRKANDPTLTSTDRQKASSWLKTHERIRDGTPMQARLVRQYVKAALVEMEAIVTRKTTKIIVSTCNNSEPLYDMGFRPNVVMIDEAAFGTEPDCCIPLMFGQSHAVFHGDHKQLKPVVQVVQLKENYRTHPDIANLPGILSYEWLDSAQRTRTETDMFRRIRDWFNKSEYKTLRRRPAYGASAHASIRRLLFNVPTGTSAAPENSESKPHQISILTGYKEQLEEIKVMLTMDFLRKGYTNIPQVFTIYSIQGGQNEFTIIDITAANEFHPSLIGFIKEWNRMNVALTRARQFLWMVGNLDAWRRELGSIVQVQRAKNFAFLIIDLLDLGDIIDMRNIANRLPISFEEYKLTASRDWTGSPAQGEDKSYLTKKDLQKIAEYRWKMVNFEKNLLEKLQELRDKTAKHQADHDAGKHVNLPSGGVDQNVDG
ncbi:6673daf5-29dc-474a-aa64-82e0f807b877 [Sclerotinia trifoliorum]|uniref:6673daf5-29dc-474a-aa64-82e0f807b877 n=1 Tax=Sclerotinia trifoliorum TaxID=28548 RepID=A0A8H2VYP8_9HELO|nr:6673daf5-29dc-474a-aa64-82e0f807b877 [Sclerotinia trifoliorum]